MPSLDPWPSDDEASLQRAPRVLVAEDDDAFRTLLSQALREDGFEVTEVDNGRALLTLIVDALGAASLQEHYDVVVSDVRMPGYDALQVLGLLQHALRGTPVLLVTAFADGETRRRALELGAWAVFDKPFEIDDLRTVAVNVVSAHNRWRPSGPSPARRRGPALEGPYERPVRKAG